MKITKFKIYLIVELLLFIALLIFQIIYISRGYSLTNKKEDLFVAIAIFHVVITLVSLSFACYLLFTNIKSERIREDLFPIYFLFALMSDIFFSLEKTAWLGHLFFIGAYITFMFIRRAKIFEYIVVLAVGIIGIILLVVLDKYTPIMALDSFLAPILLLNMVMCIINYVKKKDKDSLLLMIALISIVLSDVSIGLTVITSNRVFINTVCLITWPTYILGCVLLNHCYQLKRTKE